MSDYWSERFKLTHRLEGVSNALADDIEKSLEGALERVSGKIIVLEAKAERSKSVKHRLKWLKQQEAEINRVLKQVYREIGNDIKVKSIEIAQAAPELSAAMIENTRITIKLGVPKLSKNMVEAWHETAQIKGTFFNDYLLKLEKNAAARVVAETRIGMSAGETYKQMGQRIQNALDIGKRSAESLARTSVNQAYNWGETRYHLENQDIISKERFVAELDRRTTPICRSLDGKVFPIAEGPMPPIHMNCRSMRMPVFKDAKLDAILNSADTSTRPFRMETDPRTVHHRDGTTSTAYRGYEVRHFKQNVTYNQAMTQLVNSNDPLDRKFAKEALGPTRYDLVKSGKLQMETLYYRGKLRTIKELKRLTNG